MSKKLVKFRVHTAVFLDDKGNPVSELHLFINVRNDGTKDITIYRVSSINASGSLKMIKNEQRPVPVTLAPGKEWETWVPATIFESKDHYFMNFVLKYNSIKGKILELRSTQRYNVPKSGPVPTGK
jgi:hypothetical protein